MQQQFIAHSFSAFCLGTRHKLTPAEGETFASSIFRRSIAGRGRTSSFVRSFVSSFFPVAFQYRRLFHNFALVYDKAKMNFLAPEWMLAHT